MARKAEAPFVSIIAGHGTVTQRVRRTTPIDLGTARIAQSVAIVQAQYPDDVLTLVPSNQPDVAISIEALLNGEAVLAG